jgi:processive 1,2-diacylglycerol beta-glucosyltransferase
MICYSDAGNGPLRASEALDEALHVIYGENVDVMLLDVLKETSSFGFLAVRLYNYLLTKSLTWNTLALQIFYRSQLVKSGALLEFSVKSVLKLLEKEKPDVLVFTNPWVIGYVMRAVGKMKEPKPKIVSMLIDLGCGQLPPSWFDPDIDMYIAPTDEARDELVSFGAAVSQIQVLGMPISLEYLHDYRGQETPLACDGCAGKRLILVMGGRAGTRNTFEIVKWLMRADFPLHVVVLCGKNNGLKKQIENRLSRIENTTSYRHVHVLGFEAADPCPLMRASDIIITKPGALTVSEVATLGKALILDTYPVVMGQELGNVKYVESRGLGLIAHTPAEVPKLVSMLINDKGEVLPSRSHMDKKIAGTIEIAKAVAGLAFIETPKESIQETASS